MLEVQHWSCLQSAATVPETASADVASCKSNCAKLQTENTSNSRWHTTLQNGHTSLCTWRCLDKVAEKEACRACSGLLGANGIRKCGHRPSWMLIGRRAQAGVGCG
eukprot:289202-Amphidinium_carterae.1